MMQVWWQDRLASPPESSSAPGLISRSRLLTDGYREVPRAKAEGQARAKGEGHGIPGSLAEHGKGALRRALCVKSEEGVVSAPDLIPPEPAVTREYHEKGRGPVQDSWRAWRDDG